MNLLGALDKLLGKPYNNNKEGIMSNLSASLEDYLEIICNLLETSQSVKAVEIAKKLNISRASVSEALTKLAEKDYIIYEGHKGITITEKGLKKAQAVIDKHNTLTTFFTDILNLEKEEAISNACKVEHVISDELFEKLKQFKQFCDSREDIIKDFKETLI